MSKTINVNDGRGADYDIRISNGFQELSELLKPFLDGERKAVIVSDSNVVPLYGETIRNIIINLGNTCEIFTFPAGEDNKTLDTVKDLYEFLIEKKIERRDILVALGGGVTGDLTGFAAATYLRGIDFVQIPTSLLAQTDSSIGGKTGVDLSMYKNMVGAFHQPRLCYMNMDTLKTLDKRQILSGLGEVIKAALIKNRDFYDWLMENADRITELDHDSLNYMIEQACLIKRDVVRNDPREQGERALLNFGHTLGHAIEKAAEFALTHGECVVLGMIAALFISEKRGMISGDDRKKTLELFEKCGYTMKISGIEKSKVIDFSKSDKKMEGGVLKFILLDGVGNAVIVRDVTEDEISRAMDEVLEG